MRHGHEVEDWGNQARDTGAPVEVHGGGQAAQSKALILMDDTSGRHGQLQQDLMRQYEG